MIEPFQKTALTYGRIAAEAVEELSAYAYKDRRQSGKFLENLMTTQGPEIQIAAAIALGKVDSDLVVDLVIRLLKQDPTFQESGVKLHFHF
ncbi:HEAT repeat domain-containing protein [Leptospira alstonii]|uniref:HEAT repeat domain-containing protein n=1 Tax=Leptospira alstonii TaxID=28452 RepID=UPI00055CED74|nr:HEAT repeat domain-containing protein [Leptospira alstonii]